MHSAVRLIVINTGDLDTWLVGWLQPSVNEQTVNERSLFTLELFTQPESYPNLVNERERSNVNERERT